jgi:hypothetical protein
MDVSFRDLVEAFAERNGVLFLPRPGKTVAGRQVCVCVCVCVWCVVGGYGMGRDVGCWGVCVCVGGFCFTFRAWMLCVFVLVGMLRSVFLFRILACPVAPPHIWCVDLWNLFVLVDEYHSDRSASTSPILSTIATAIIITTTMQVYAFGGVPAYLDSDVVFADLEGQGQYAPIALEALLERVQQGGGR